MIRGVCGPAADAPTCAACSSRFRPGHGRQLACGLAAVPLDHGLACRHKCWFSAEIASARRLARSPVDGM